MLVLPQVSRGAALLLVLPQVSQGTSVLLVLPQALRPMGLLSVQLAKRLVRVLQHLKRHWLASLLRSTFARRQAQTRLPMAAAQQRVFPVPL